MEGQNGQSKKEYYRLYRLNNKQKYVDALKKFRAGYYTCDKCNTKIKKSYRQKHNMTKLHRWYEGEFNKREDGQVEIYVIPENIVSDDDLYDI